MEECNCQSDDLYHFLPPQLFDNLSSFLGIWIVSFSKHSVCCYLPFFSIWVVWKERNQAIFEGKKPSLMSMIQQIVYFSQLYKHAGIKEKKPRAIGAGPVLVFPYGFFDGAATNNSGGVKFCLYLNESHSFEFAFWAGTCTNTKAELIAPWALLHTTQLMGIPKLNIFGDSAVIISWAKGIAALNPPALSHWCRDTRRLFSCFHHLSFSHIFREHNQQADCLSKSALTLAPGCGKYSEFIEGLVASHDSFQLY